MTEQQKKILAVLDMSYDEQWEWLEKKYGGGAFHSFETLAWTLRNKAGARFYTAMRMMYDELTNDSNPDGFGIWWMLDTKPIHWIIAALLAKESK